MILEDKEIKVLIVDDEPRSIATNEIILKAAFKNIDTSELSIESASSIEEMFSKLNTSPFHLVLLDWNLGIDGEGNITSGVSHIPDIKAYQPNAEIVVVTTNNTIDLIIESMLLGAAGYVIKDPAMRRKESNNKWILRALKTAKDKLISEKIEILDTKNKTSFSHRSSAMNILDFNLRKIAEFDGISLITGETGLGKTHTAKRLAELIATHKNQSKIPFVHVDINSIPENLIESELFGHEKGSFSGADTTKAGLFEAANGGVLYLDEIQDLPLSMQVKLRVALEEGYFRRVGGRFNIKYNARIIISSNKDLEKMVEEGSFKEDLYARISAIKIDMPPLNKRKEDIPYICNNLIKEISKKRKNIPTFTFFDLPAQLQQHLLRDNIPLNIRGLRNILTPIIALSNVDKFGKIDFTNWKHHLSIKTHKPRKTSIDFSSTPITYEDFSIIKTNFLGEDSSFKGIQEAKKLLEEKLISESMKKFKTNKERGNYLNLAESNVSTKVNSLKKKMMSEAKQ